MRFALALALSSSALLAAAPRSARADCASPHATLSPRPGSTLPPDPTLYLFLPALSGGAQEIEVQVDGGGEALPVQVSVASRTEALTVLRITVQTGDHRTITLQPLASPSSWKADFAVAPSRRRVGRTPVRLRSARHERDEWMCSFTDAWLLAPAVDADAFRVEWAATPSAWERGEQASAIFPRHEMDLWSPPHQDTPRPASIALGHVSCFAYTIPEEAVRGPLYVKVVGLYADGSETPAWPTPRRLDANGMEAGRAPAAPAPPPAATVVPSAPARAATTSSTAPPVTPDVAVSPVALPALAALAGLSGLILVVAALRRRRARAARMAPPPR